MSKGIDNAVMGADTCVVAGAEAQRKQERQRRNKHSMSGLKHYQRLAWRD